MPTTPTLTALNLPVDYSSAHGDLVYVFKSDEFITTPADYPNFKYIIDIFYGLELIGTIKAVPNPSTKYGVFNLGNIVRNYVNSRMIANTIVDYDTKDYGVNISIQAGYEYGTIVTQYHNVTADSKWYFNHYNGRLYGNYTWLSYYANGFISNRPDKTNVIFGQPLFYSFLTTTSNTIAAELMRVSFATYNSSYSRTGGTSINITYEEFQAKIFNLNALNINSLVGYSLITPNTYALRINVLCKNAEGDTVNVDSPYFIYTCEPKYSVKTLVFMNKLGGYDSYDFYKVSKKSYEIEKKEYSRIPYDISSTTGTMTYYTNENFIIDRQITYYGNYKEKIVVNSDNINEDTYKWLAELILSPQIFLFENGMFVPMLIKATNYDFKTKIVDKIFNLQIELDYADSFNVQYR